MGDYRKLLFWQKAVDVSIAVYELTEKFPNSELYGLTSQMRRSAVSVASNIAEGSRRGTRKDLRQFLNIAFGSGAELETQIEIVKKLPFGKSLNFERISLPLEEVMKMLNVSIKKLSS